MIETLIVKESYDLKSFPELKDDTGVLEFAEKKKKQIYETTQWKGKKVTVQNIEGFNLFWDMNDHLFKMDCKVTIRYHG